MPKINKVNAYLILILLIIFCVFQYGIQKIYGFTMYPDEFGYWASAANAIGYDWSEVASMGSYYSFGYSLILIPVLKLFSGGTAAYRAAVAVNMLLMCISVFLLQKIAGKLFPDMDEIRRIFVSGIAVLYPPWIFYMQMTMAEALLFFMFVLVTYLFLCFVERPKAVTAAALSVFLVYIYCVHMRTAGVVIACIISCLLWGITHTEKKKQMIVLAGVFAIAGWIAFELKNRTVLEVFSYAEKEILARNDYGSQWGKFKEIFTVQGLFKLLKGITGKIFYLGLSSFGTFYWAVGWCVKESISLIKNTVKKESVLLKQWGAVFLLLAVTGEVLISSIYMYNAGYVDCLIYGRYNELLVPVIMIIGLAVMGKSRFLFSYTLIMGAVSGGMALILLNVTETEKLKGLRGYHIAGVSYLIKENNMNIYLFFRDTWMLGFGLMLLVCILVWLSRRLKGGVWILSGILLMETALGLQVSNHYTYRVNYVNYENMMIAEAIKENWEEKDTIVYLDGGYPEFIDFLQMLLPEKSIHVAAEEMLKNGELPGDFVITHAESQKEELLQKIYNKKVTANTFCLYFNQDT